MARALSMGVISRREMSSVTSSEQCKRKLCMTDRAPARPSSVTCHVNASPRAFSDSISLPDRGNELRHSSSIRGSRPLTTGTPSVMIAPINSHPACVRFKDNRLFWLADRSNSSAVLNTTLPFVCGMPSGDRRTLPSTAANAAL